MGLESIFEKFFSKEGTLSLPVALHVSTFLFFADICIHMANIHPFTPWISAAENVPSLLFSLFGLLAIFSVLSSHLIPAFACLLTFLVPSSMSSGSKSDDEAREFVLKDQYERFAVETNNATMLALVTQLKEEGSRHFRNVGLFLMWMWLVWAELRFCLSVTGTIGNRVMPLPVSPWINLIGALICLGITVLLVIGSANNRSSSRIIVSKKLRLEIEEREKGPTPAIAKESNHKDVALHPLTFPSEPMIGFPGKN